jgi:hypothetical protein
MFKWINAKDRLPEDNDHIIMVNNSDQIFSGMGRLFNKKLNLNQDPLYFREYYTHWMLLPTPPFRDIK